MSNEAAIRRIKAGAFALDGKTSQAQEELLREFMHENFQRWEVGDNRGGGIFVEYPPSGVCRPTEWQDSLDKILKPEWYSLHPMIRRRKVIARFVPKLIDREEGVEVGGNATIPKAGGSIQEHWIRIPLITAWGDLIDQKEAVFTIVHELAEVDFWQKTTKGEWRERYREDQQSAILLRQRRHKEYEQLTDERIANLRAERALRRKWPDFTMED